MSNFLKSASCKVILCVIALLAGVMIYAVFLGGYTISGVGLFKKAAAPFQKISNGISSKVEYVLDLYTGAEQYYQENQALKQEVATLYKELAEYEDMQTELKEMREFLGIKERHPDVVISSPFPVLGFVANDPYGAFMIDGGSADGIHLYDPVVTEQGLVGVISELGEKTSTVTTLLSPDLSIAAYCSRTRDRGIICGSVRLLAEGKCRMQYLDKQHNLKEDNVILTTGENGFFPKNYIIGYVKETGMDDTGLTAYAAIEPAADLKNISRVIVITDFSGKDTRND